MGGGGGGGGGGGVQAFQMDGKSSNQLLYLKLHLFAI